MELVLTYQTEAQVNVICDKQFSHTFDPQPLLLPKDQEEERLFKDPASYGQTLYDALFAPDTLARQSLLALPERILLVATDNNLDAIPWEYVYGPNGFLVQEYHFVRGLPVGQRLPVDMVQT